MKQRGKTVITVSLFLMILLLYSQKSEAKIYYDTKLNHVGKEIALIQQPAGMVNFHVISDYCSCSTIADFNQDGKKETVRVKVDGSNIKVEVNGSRVLSTNSKMNLELITLRTYKVGNAYFAALLYGKLNFKEAKGKIFKWEKNNTLKLLKTKTAKGNLWICPKDNTIIIRDTQQLARKDWSKTLVKQYAKWKNKSNVAVIKTVYSKCIYKSGKLENKGSDTYYRIYEVKKK